MTFIFSVGVEEEGIEENVKEEDYQLEEIKRKLWWKRKEKLQYSNIMKFRLSKITFT